MTKTKTILAYAIPFAETCEIFGNEKIYTCSCGDWFYIYMGRYYSESETGTDDVFDLNSERMSRGKIRYKGYQFGVFTVTESDPDNCTCKRETCSNIKTVRVDLDCETNSRVYETVKPIKFDTQRAYDVFDGLIK